MTVQSVLVTPYDLKKGGNVTIAANFTLSKLRIISVNCLIIFHQLYIIVNPAFFSTDSRLNFYIPFQWRV